MDELEFLKRSAGPVTRDRLIHDLVGLGLAEGDIVMFHTRMSALGYVAGGPQTIVDALRDTVGDATFPSRGAAGPGRTPRAWYP